MYCTTINFFIINKFKRIFRQSELPELKWAISGGRGDEHVCVCASVCVCKCVCASVSACTWFPLLALMFITPSSHCEFLADVGNICSSSLHSPEAWWIFKGIFGEHWLPLAGLQRPAAPTAPQVSLDWVCAPLLGSPTPRGENTKRAGQALLARAWEACSSGLATMDHATGPVWLDIARVSSLLFTTLGNSSQETLVSQERKCCPEPLRPRTQDLPWALSSHAFRFSSRWAGHWVRCLSWCLQVFTKDETDNLPSLCGPQGYIPVTQMSKLRLTELHSPPKGTSWLNGKTGPWTLFYIVLFLLLCQLLYRQTQDYDYPSKWHSIRFRNYFMFIVCPA